VVILDPDQIAVFDNVGYFLGEFGVGFAVGVPGGFVEVDFARMVVEEGPCVRYSSIRGRDQRIELEKPL